MDYAMQSAQTAAGWAAQTQATRTPETISGTLNGAHEQLEICAKIVTDLETRLGVLMPEKANGISGGIGPGLNSQAFALRTAAMELRGRLERMVGSI